MYRVVKFFTDSYDDGYAYNVGDKFPRDGLEVSEERLNKLLSANNRQKAPLIVKVEHAVRQETVEQKVEEPKQEEKLKPQQKTEPKPKQAQQSKAKKKK